MRTSDSIQMKRGASKRRLLSIFLAAAAIVTVAGAAGAMDFYWDNTSGDFDWFNPDNWYPQWEPFPHDYVVVANDPIIANAPITIDGYGRIEVLDVGFAFDSLIVGEEGEGSSFFRVPDSSENLMIRMLTLGRFAGSWGAAEFEWEGGESTLTIPDGMIIGASGEGVVTMPSMIPTEIGGCVLGLFHQSKGSLLVDRAIPYANLTFVCRGDLTVGACGQGTLEIGRWATLQSQTAMIGFGSTGEDAEGLVILDDATWDIDGLLVVGYSGVGRIEGGGTLTCDGAIIGGRYDVMAPGEGHVELDTHWTNSGDLYVGEAGRGSVVVQSSHVTSADVYLGFAEADEQAGYPAGEGTVTASGTWECRNMFVGGWGKGDFNFTGGELVVDGRLYIGWQPGSEGVVTVTNSTLTVNDLFIGGDEFNGLRRDGRLRVLGQDATVVVTGELQLGACGEWFSSSGSRYDLLGASLTNKSTNPEGSDLAGATVRFSIESGQTATFEAASADDGAVLETLEGRFAIGRLLIESEAGGSVRLVDESDNTPETEGADAVYVHSLQLAEGSTLDLNGLNLYYVSLQDYGGSIIGDGHIGQIDIVIEEPEPTIGPGDINRDGKVDLDDFVILKNNFGRTPDVVWTDGDLNGDGRIDLADFLVLKENFMMGR